MLTELLHRHLVTLFMILLFGIILWPRKTFRNTETRYFWLTLIVCFLLVVEDIVESMAAQDPSLRYLRITMSVLGYTLRSLAALSLLLVVIPRKQRTFVLWIPTLLTFLLCSTAFFSGIVFGYHEENYEFFRGSLGHSVFVAPILYLLLILVVTFSRFVERKSVEKNIVIVGGLFCLMSSYMDAVYGGVRLTEAFMISSIFFYFFLYSHDNRRDPLTGLLNRQAFYDDCSTFDRRIGAVMSLDLNGLKQLNDSSGHHAGDKALTLIGRSLLEVMDQTALAYRIGGDEFLILFFHRDEQKIAQVEERLRQIVAKRGYSLSFGYAMRGQGSLDRAIKESDLRMYADKAAYYKTHEQDRQRTPAPASKEP